MLKLVTKTDFSHLSMLIYCIQFIYRYNSGNFFWEMWNSSMLKTYGTNKL